MATSYVGYRNVLQRGTFPLSSDHDRYARYSTTGVLAGFPDERLTDDYDPLFGNARIPMEFQPLEDPGDRAGEKQPNPLYHYGVEGAKVLSGDTGWSTNPQSFYSYYGLSTATVLDEVGINTEQIDYYHLDRVTPQALADPGREPRILPNHEDDLNVWQGVPSSKAL